MSIEIAPELLEGLNEEELGAVNNLIASAALGLEDDRPEVVRHAESFMVSIRTMLRCHRTFGSKLRCVEGGV